MKKFQKIIKDFDYIIYTFLISIIIISIIYKLQEVAPFGKNSLLKIDFYHQYGPMLGELFDRIHQGENLIYTFNTGLGLPFFRNFFNYLSSPFNIIILLFKRENLLMSYSILLGIKVACAASTMTYYLHKKLQANTKKYLLIGIGLLYAFSAYFSAYYWNIMWIDGMIFLPLIILGIENIIDKQNGILYTLSLTIMLYTNYFIAYMICIFSIIYFISYCIIKKVKFNKFIKYGTKFFICSLIAGLLMAWALIPMFEALMTTSATGSQMPTSQYYSFTILEFIKNHITGVIPTVFASDITNSPNVSCGILSIALLLVFIINNNINLRKKITYVSILLLLITSFYFGQLDYIWHAFHVPNDLPYRYSFIYTFIMLSISAYSLKYIKKLSLPKAIAIYILIIIYLTLIKMSNFENITNKMLNINYILITTYFLIYTLYHLYPKCKKLTIFLTIIVISLECIISINNNWDIDQNIKSFYSDYNEINKTITNLNDDELFYRIEKNNILTLNDGAWYDYYGLTTFSSMAYDSIAILNNDLGQPGNYINSYYYKQNTPIYDLMFNIKYTIGNNVDTKIYEYIDNENNIEIYKFKYTNGLMYGVNNDIINWKYNYDNPFEYQNSFITNSTNINNTLYPVQLKTKEIIESSEKETIIKYTLLNEQDNIYIHSNDYELNYIIIDDSIYYKDDVDLAEVQLKLNKNIYNFENYDEEYVITKDTKNKYIEIFISYKDYYNQDLNIYTIDYQKFLEAYNILKEKQIKITEFKENVIKGTITLEEKTIIYTSIPYDKGWKVYANNKQIDTIILNNSLLGFKLDKGNNNIKLKYIPNNIDIGISLSITTMIFSITYLIIKKKTNHQ